MKVQVFPISTLQQDGACCSLIILEDHQHPGKKLQIMVDCGLNQNMDIRRLKHYQKKIQKTNLVLLSQSSLEFSGGLPIMTNTQMIHPKTSIFAPSPVVDYGFRDYMDQYLILQQQFLKNKEDEEGKQEEEFTKVLQSAEDSYNRITRMNFGQKQQLTYADEYFQVTIWPVRAGKTVGACAWRINVNMINIIFLTDFSMNKDIHIDSAAIDKLLTITHQSQTLSRQQLDFLIVNNPIPKEQTKQANHSIKQTISEALGQTLQNKQTSSQIILAFYPNERILEGIMAIDDILYDHPELLGLRCELYTNYKDLIEKARGQTDFLGSSLVNWRHQEQTHQTPLDPDYLKNRFLNIKNSSNLDDQIQHNTRILITTYNNLFFGPLSSHFQPLINNPQNIVIMFGQPPSTLTEGLRVIKSGFKGQIDCQLKEQDSITYNAIKKIMLKKVIDPVIQDRKLEGTLSENQQGISVLSTTQRGGQDSSSNISVDQAKSQDKMIDESYEKTMEQPEALEQEQVLDLFDRVDEYQNFKPQTTINAYEGDQLTFSTDRKGAIAPMSELFGREPFGIESPAFFKKEVQMVSNYIIKNQQQFVLESESEQDNSQAQQVLSTKQASFEFPKKISQQLPTYFSANLHIQQQAISQTSFKLLIEQLNPKYIHFLNPMPKKSYGNQEFTTTSSGAKDFLDTVHIANLPFLQANQNELKDNNITRVNIVNSIKAFQGQKSMNQLISISKHNQQTTYKVGKSQKILLLALLKQLKEQNIDCLLGFGQISVENNQMIITKRQNGFHLEGGYGQLFSRIRQIIQNFQMNKY